MCVCARVSLCVLNRVIRNRQDVGERCYLTASLFLSPREYVKHSVTNCLFLPLVHKREH